MNKVVICGLKFAIDHYMSSHVSVLSGRYDVSVLPIESIIYSFDRRGKFSILKDLYYIRNFIINEKPFFVITVGPKVGFLFSIVCALLKVRHIHWFTGQVWALSRFKYFALGFYIDFFISFFSFKSFTDGHNQSKFLRENLCSRFKFHCPSVPSINGLSSKFDECRSTVVNRRKVIFAGRFCQDKGIQDFLLVARHFSSTNLSFHMYGSFDVYEEHSRFKKDAALLPNLNIHEGSYDSKSIYDDAFLLILPTKREGFCSTLIEAQACGVPVLVSNIYGVRDAFVNFQTGLSCNDLEDFLRAVALLLENDSLHGLLSRNAVQFSSKFKAFYYARSLNDFYLSHGV